MADNENTDSDEFTLGFNEGAAISENRVRAALATLAALAAFTEKQN